MINNLTQEQIEFINNIVDGVYYINDKNKLCCDDGIYLKDSNKYKKMEVEFEFVRWNFIIDNHTLTSTEGMPKFIGGDLLLNSNSLEKLVIPDDLKISGDFVIVGDTLKNYFSNVQEEDFKHWDKIKWFYILGTHPRLISIAKNYIPKDKFIELVERYPKTKLYLR
jgi:hypothetical protein